MLPVTENVFVAGDTAANTTFFVARQDWRCRGNKKT
jgi:hypothetical protein